MKRPIRLLSLLAIAVLLLAACSTAEETEPETATEAGGETEMSEPAVEELSEPAADAEADAAEEPADTAGQSILDIAQDNPQLSQLVAALQAAGLTDALDQAGPLTVFAPNDQAFAALDQSDLAALLADPTSLGDILQYHVVEGSFPSSDLSDGQALTTLQGSELSVAIDGSTVTVGDAEVVQADIEAGNGVIHVIDTVLTPPS